MAGAGIRLFATGAVLSAAQVNEYLMDQTIHRFLDITARTTAYSTAGVTLAEGMFSYLDSTNKLYFYTGSAWEEVGAQIEAGEVTDTEVSATAGIALSKLAGAVPGEVVVHNLTGVPTATALSGDITVNYLGVTAIASGVIVNADIKSDAAIEDTKLATIATAGKVDNSATTAASANTNSAIVARDSSGNFAAGKATLATVDVKTVVETASIVAAASTGTINIDFSTNPTVYYTSDATANWTLNVRGTSSVTLNNTLTTGQIATVTFLATIGTTQRRPTVFQVDGSAVTPKWMGGTAPTTGNASSIDAYTLAIIKTGNAAFTMLASQSRFA
jgi:hypothetical protein